MDDIKAPRTVEEITAALPAGKAERFAADLADADTDAVREQVMRTWEFKAMRELYGQDKEGFKAWVTREAEESVNKAVVGTDEVLARLKVAHAKAVKAKAEEERLARLLVASGVRGVQKKVADVLGISAQAVSKRFAA